MKKHVVFALAGLVVGLMLFAHADAQMMQGQKQVQGMGGGMTEQGMNCCMMRQGMHGGMMGGMMGDMMGQAMHGGFNFYLNRVDDLDLSQAQTEKLRDMRLEFEKGNIQRKAAIEVAQVELKQLKMSDNVDLKKVEAKIREIQNKKADLEVATFQAQVEAKNVLTAEQKAKLKAEACPFCRGMHGKGMMHKGMMHEGGIMHHEEED